MNDIWYVLHQHWDDDLNADSDVMFFNSREEALHYAQAEADKAAEDYQVDFYSTEITCIGDCVEACANYAGSDAVACDDTYKIGKVEPLPKRKKSTKFIVSSNFICTSELGFIIPVHERNCDVMCDTFSEAHKIMCEQVLKETERLQKIRFKETIKPTFEPEDAYLRLSKSLKWWHIAKIEE